MTAIWLEKFEDYERAGFRERPGKSSNPVILKWAHGAGKAKWVTDDATPWCGIAMAGVLDECGLGVAVPPEPAAAISWMKCGVPCEPKPGAIAIFPRKGGNHVTVIRRIEGNIWHCIGGNQSDSICTTKFDGSQARGTRWPIKEKTPAELADKSRIAAAAQRQQRDAAKTTGAGLTTQAPIPEPTGWEPQVTGWLAEGSKWKGMGETAVSIASFFAGNWRVIVGAVALYFLARAFYDGKMIARWRAEDHNGGFTR